MEPFLRSCRNCGKKLASGLAEVRANKSNSNIQETMIKLLTDSKLLSLLKEGDENLNQLHQLEMLLNGNSDTR